MIRMADLIALGCTHIVAQYDRWLSDDNIVENEPEILLPAMQALFFGVPIVLVGIAIMAVLP